MEEIQTAPIEVAKPTPKEWKRLARRDYNSVGIALILQVVFIYAISWIIREFVYDSLVGTAYGLIIYILIYYAILGMQNIVPFLYFFKKQKDKVKDAVSYRQHIKVYDVFKGTVFCLGMNVLVSLVIGLITVFLRENGVEAQGADFSFTGSALYNILLVVFSVIVAPITEEVLHRGFIYHTLRPYGRRFAIGLSAALFALVHGNIYQTIPTFFIGLYLAYITEVTGNIYTAIAVHMMNNLMATLTGNELIPPEVSYPILLLCLVGSIVYWMIWKMKGTKIENQRDVPKAARVPALLTSFFMVVMVVIYIVMIAMTFSFV